MMKNSDDTSAATPEQAALDRHAQQDAEGRKQFEKQWQKTNPVEMADENERERQRLWREIIEQQANTVITRGTETRHMRTVLRARDTEN